MHSKDTGGIKRSSLFWVLSTMFSQGYVSKVSRKFIVSTIKQQSIDHL